MELLKVFVGDGANTGTTVATMVKGDLLLLDATTYAAATSGSTAVVIAGKNDNGVYYSSPITNANVLYANLKNDVAAVEKVVTAVVGTLDVVANTTYTIGVQIKEDLRMGTYNKNTEILSSYVAPPSIAGLTDIVLKADMASTIAKGFSANPLTSAGSPSQLVRAMRVFTALPTGAEDTAATFTLTPGSKQITWVTGTDTLAAGVVAGVILNLGDSWYLVDKVDSTNGIITLDTAYQGTNTTATKNATEAITTAFYVPVANYPDGFTFKFTAIAQTQQNRYDQFRMTEFIVITPKGFDTSLSTSLVVTETAATQPIGSYRQVRDLEEKAYTNSNPLINYREFPFQDFALNANPTVNTYDIFTITYNAASGYNYLQSSGKVFPQTVVVAAPAQSSGQFDRGASGSFANLFDAWYSGANIFADI